ncbi:hypothetical protein AAFF_G00195900 [Aldrovandia affinis]|uniref:Uncharacterized protein n=1 Tax=Aldrovandia affinis TaxID=143900 RepID=A0AAD7RJ45_9TELE|nr:hypothetical protein AAFF_G00195900 [Aldrovandia affinis]
MEPFAGLVCRDLGVDVVRLPGAAGEVLKIQQCPDRPLWGGNGLHRKVVVRSVLLLLLLHLAYVFPVCRQVVSHSGVPIGVWGRVVRR